MVVEADLVVVKVVVVVLLCELVCDSDESDTDDPTGVMVSCCACSHLALAAWYWFLKSSVLSLAIRHSDSELMTVLPGS